jgi:branched-chain amino acid transport system substrate-binding protein
VKAFRAKFGKVPSYYSENNYTTAMWLDEAIKKAGGKFPGPEELIKIMVGIKLDRTPRGPVSFDDMRNPIQNIYIKKVEKKKMFGYDKDELWNTVTKTYPNVSQFWTYGKDKFLAQPVYDKNFPPCKFCE